MLDFGFSPHDDMLEANLPGGFIHIAGNSGNFIVRAYYRGTGYDIGNQKTIYEALDAANAWWQQKEFENYGGSDD